VVEAVFAERAVLPAPPGALFRSRAALTAWMELHAASLAEGLRFVEGRSEVRVTAESSAGGATAGESPVDPVAMAAEAFASLRREAVAMLVVRPEPAPGDAGHAAGEPPAADAAASGDRAQAAFLVDRVRWAAFVDAVAREGRRQPRVRLACAGPWPPYTFVRLDFAG
jgi:hypothetical protein